ncbi:lytic transglycosylase catalytic [Caballeronia calidae]|uniref:Lytic transglycosylase catalytic n=1 Tax=Caballeronia calidae TaxID=1777139 RepID=A0A158CIK0_9BURK|nr:lytic transglycosylase [Caballeronia calidae]SAK82091.1 lytic transglycosylase catalytic [Caballeronia calidae]
MTKAWAAACLSAVPFGAHAATIDSIISPTRIVVDDGTKRAIVELPGEPVYACGLKPFLAWANRFEGQTVEATAGGIAINIDGSPISLESLFVKAGWLRPATLTDDAQASIAERRGGWSCASAQAPFDAMHTSVDPKILAGIALNESAYNGRAWPWTLNVAGRGFFFRTREDAYRAVRYLISNGRSNFDIGLMQINRNLRSCYTDFFVRRRRCDDLAYTPSKQRRSCGFVDSQREWSNDCACKGEGDPQP